MMMHLLTALAAGVVVLLLLPVQGYKIAASNGGSSGSSSDGAGGGGGTKTIIISNKCQDTLHVGVLTNGQSSSAGDGQFDVTAGSNKVITKSDHWGGRVWGRKQCSGTSGQADSCSTPPGASNPASLAEFFFKGAGGKDYYDISLVDGYNLPVSITPSHEPQSSGSSKYNCGAPSCNVPACPKDYAIVDSTGNVVACQSTCSKENTPQACCTGAHDNPNTCKPDNRSEAVKSACPDAYSVTYI